MSTEVWGPTNFHTQWISCVFVKCWTKQSSVDEIIITFKDQSDRPLEIED